MVFRLISVFVCCCLIPAWLLADPLASGFLFIQYLGKHKEKNGQVCQAFKVVCTDQKVDAVAVFYQAGRGPTLYQARVTDAGFAICTDQPNRIRVFAIARTPHETLLASTDTVLFGQSKTPPHRLRADLTAKDFTSIHPSIDLISPQNHYWPQTGEIFRFKIKAPFDPGQLDLSVFENGQTRNLVKNRQTEFAYVPPHDPGLRKAGIRAFRNDILFARVTDGVSEFKLTYSLMVHRSRYAFDNPVAGTAVFASSVLFFAGLVLRKRKTPWWKKSG